MTQKASNDFAFFLKTESTFRFTSVTKYTVHIRHSPWPQYKFMETQKVLDRYRNKKEEFLYIFHKPGNCLLLSAVQTFNSELLGCLTLLGRQEHSEHPGAQVSLPPALLVPLFQPRACSGRPPGTRK